MQRESYYLFLRHSLSRHIIHLAVALDVENAVYQHFLCLVRFKADILNSGRITGRLYG